MYNYNASSATLQGSFTQSQTLNYAITDNGSVSIDVIFGSVSFGAGVTLGKSTSESFSGTAIVNNVPAHVYGVVQLGDAYYKSVGTYYYQDSYCTESQIVQVTVRFPENPNSTLLLAGVSPTETTPWLQTS